MTMTRLRRAERGRAKTVPVVSRRRTMAGFTLVELMVVVAIMGILAAGAVILTRRERVGEGARNVASLLQEAHRHAVGGGGVRSDVFASIGENARTRVEFSTVSGHSVVSLYDLVEDPLPAATAQWVLVTLVNLPEEVEVYGVADVAQSIPDGPLPPALGAGTLDKRFFPNGSAQAMTVFVRKRGQATGPDRYRIVVLPLSGIPETFKGW